jgi:hypothetical protein
MEIQVMVLEKQKKYGGGGGFKQVNGISKWHKYRNKQTNKNLYRFVST